MTNFPPQIIPVEGYKVFLAGSIEMDKAAPWQDHLIKALSDLNVCWLNPRRQDWDSSWKAEKSNPIFAEQVNWELNGLEQADLILMYFDPRTKSPISLLELGLFARSGNMLVCCPAGFWRKGNVDIVCERYGVGQFDEWDAWLEAVRARIIAR
ncbi:MAG: nucleoside 2-deoxyribosyltransferase domain-containing protein [Bacteroidota bacterium]